MSVSSRLPRFYLSARPSAGRLVRDGLTPQHTLSAEQLDAEVQRLRGVIDQLEHALAVARPVLCDLQHPADPDARTALEAVDAAIQLGAAA